MKRHPTLSTVSHDALDRSDTGEAARGRTLADSQANRSEIAHAQPQLTLTNEPLWRHRLILTGKLDHDSASEFEDEIECLCEEGVTTLTLDLRRLDAIDPTGITAIAHRGSLCRMCGRDFAVIAGSRVVRRALADAGATDLLVSDLGVNVVRGSRGLPVASDACRSTTMVKDL
jgi:anti-anti-sigma factor